MTGRPPRLLYLARAFPPAPAIGSVRAWNTAKWLAASGWAVTVVTPEPSVWLHPDEPEKVQERLRSAGIARILTGHAWPMLMPDRVKWIPGRAGWLLGGACRVVARSLGIEASAGWGISAERACAVLARGDCDLILATGGAAAYRAAHRLSLRLGCPFLMDYRDPWTGNPHDAGRRSKSSEEARLLGACAGATVVSPSWAELIGRTFGVPEKVHVITNGFDPDMFVGVESRRFDHFAIVYAGTLYPPKRVLDPVLRALRAFAESRPARVARFHYYGDFGEPVLEAATRLGARALVEVHGRVPRRAALEAQKGSGLVVVVASVDEEAGLSDLGVVTAKVFDCMALDRPALVVAPRGSDLYAVARTAGGMRCFAGSDVEGMARYIGEVEGGRAPPALGRQAYRWDSIAGKLDGVLRAAVSQYR